jgi:hypothetical protein
MERKIRILFGAEDVSEDRAKAPEEEARRDQDAENYQPGLRPGEALGLSQRGRDILPRNKN